MKLPETGIEHLHQHSDYSILDGFAKCEEIGLVNKRNNSRFLCVTDHGMMGAIPSQLRACDKYKLNPIFGVEFYYQPNHPNSKKEFGLLDSQDKKKIKKSYHLLGLAKNETGYKNLIKLSSWGWIEGYYYKPRINKEILMKHKEGIVFTSCCYNSEIGQTFEHLGEDAALDKVKEYKEMFGDDFKLEIMLLDFIKQKPYNQFVIKASDRFNIPIHLTNDCHYAEKIDSKFQRYMLMIQKKTTIKDIETKLEEDDKAEIFELQDPNLYIKSEQELNEKWFSDYKDTIPLEIFQQSKLNSVKLAEQCKGVVIDRNPKLPQIENADELMKEELNKGLLARGINKRVYINRLIEEYDLIKRKGFCGYFMVLQKIMNEARRVTPKILGYGTPDDALVPGRGSGVGCLCLYVLGITDVDPIKHDLLFSRFLSENRGGKSYKLRFSKD